mmetsp:Transcript_25182/g.34630  ORF Transcript_25182/g.34630 Transcript_25182/m.34630 type:complete len:246 (+) Transcript_25182:348-1085(+)
MLTTVRDTTSKTLLHTQLAQHTIAQQGQNRMSLLGQSKPLWHSIHSCGLDNIICLRRCASACCLSGSFRKATAMAGGTPARSTVCRKAMTSSVVRASPLVFCCFFSAASGRARLRMPRSRLRPRPGLDSSTLGLGLLLEGVFFLLLLDLLPHWPLLSDSPCGEVGCCVLGGCIMALSGSSVSTLSTTTPSSNRLSHCLRCRKDSRPRMKPTGDSPTMPVILTFFQLPRGLFRWNTLILVWLTVTD